MGQAIIHLFHPSAGPSSLVPLPFTQMMPAVIQFRLVELPHQGREKMSVLEVVIIIRA